MKNTSNLRESTARLAANREDIRAAADGCARASLEFMLALAAFDRRLKRDGLWPGGDPE